MRVLLLMSGPPTPSLRNRCTPVNAETDATDSGSSVLLLLLFYFVFLVLPCCSSSLARLNGIMEYWQAVIASEWTVA